MNRKEKEQAEAVETLKQWGVNDGTLVYARVAKVSRSGMHRRVQLSVILTDKPTGVYPTKRAAQENAWRYEPRNVDISYHAARALGWGYKDGYDGGISVSGCGMDMLFATVDALSYAMGYGAMNQAREHIEGETTGLRYTQI